MSSQALRVVFDTSVFSATHFDTIDSSPLRLLFRRGRVVPVYTAVFLEETLRSYASPATRQDLLTRWLPFIVTTAHRFCDDLPSIWRRELVQGRGRDASIFMSAKVQESLLAHLTSIPSDGTWDFFGETQTERDADVAKSIARRNNSKAMRKEVSQLIREMNVQGTPSDALPLSAGVKAHLVVVLGYGLIERYVAPKDWRAVGTRWARDRNNYPFFTQFVENAVYQETHFMTDHTARIDSNAQADLDILTHLLRAETLVTDETGFMRTAFEALWRPRGKVVFNSMEFAEFLRKLV